MPEDATNLPQPNRPRQYQIRIGGRLNAQWSEWFDDLLITTTEDDETLITGPVADQAALLGLLRKVRDLGLPLLSVNPVESDAPGIGDAAHDQSPKE